MFFDKKKVGDFAVRRQDFRAGKSTALFKVLVTCAMFQRLRDLQVMRILREMPLDVAREVSSSGRLVRLAGESACPHLASNSALLEGCDLGKDQLTGLGTCRAGTDLACHLKRHTVHLKRYGHFGKVPTSAALAIVEEGPGGLRGLYRRVLRESSSPLEVATTLESLLSRSWRVNQKIACMFLSVVTNPALGPGKAPWSEGVDWNHFVVVDSNVDLFLEAVGYRGPGTYDARRSFLQMLAQRVDLAAMRPGLASYNARLVQQAMYLFMSASNRRLLEEDCSHLGEQACAKCPGPVRVLCTCS